MDPMAAIKETFFQECEEQLGELEAGLVRLEQGDQDPETINAVFRAVHSIKGGAGAFQLTQLVQFAHVFESVLDQMRSGAIAVSTPVLKLLLRSSDFLADLVATARAGQAADETREQALIQELQTFIEQGGAQAADEGESDFEPTAIDFGDFAGLDAPPPKNQRHYIVSFRPTIEMYRNGNESVRLLRELCHLGDASVQCDVAKVPALSEYDAAQSYLSWRIDLRTEHALDEVKEIFDFVLDDCVLDINEAVEPIAAVSEEARFTPAPPQDPLDKVDDEERREGQTVSSTAKAAASTIRVDLDRIDRLINLVGELVINQAVLSQRVMEAGVSRSSNVGVSLAALEQITREIQEGVMATRAQPVKPLFQRMGRIVREVADATGKAISLKTEGEATEIDRTMIERLADPLTHMIRNAVDHGIEGREARSAAGKPEQGEIQILAAHRSGRIIIEVADDGGGIDRARVQAIAVKKGLIPADAQLSDAEVDNLIFLPGFSTAETISDISGRGVGMDVVRRSIQALGGRISISSRPGNGSTFSMSLPLTLAVLDGMVVRVADQTLVLPLTAVVETLRPKRGDVHPLGVEGRVILDRGAIVPLIDVGRELGYREEETDPLTSVVLIVDTEEGPRRALVVDEICDQRQVVIKSLEANYRRIPGVAAATILGDGRVALILDVDSFVAKVQCAVPTPQFLAVAEG